MRTDNNHTPKIIIENQKQGQAKNKMTLYLDCIVLNSYSDKLNNIEESF